MFILNDEKVNGDQGVGSGTLQWSGVSAGLQQAGLCTASAWPPLPPGFRPRLSNKSFNKKLVTIKLLAINFKPE